MYRAYENPHDLEKKLAEMKALRDQATDEDDLFEISEEIADLEERINFAWQDDEYDSCYED